MTVEKHVKLVNPKKKGYFLLLTRSCFVCFRSVSAMEQIPPSYNLYMADKLTTDQLYQISMFLIPFIHFFKYSKRSRCKAFAGAFVEAAT